MANFNGQHGCHKCTTVGEFSYISNTNIFRKTECEKRTDAGFRLKLYEGHHKSDSPLLKLNIDMIKQFPVADSLHLLHLGVMKRLLLGWRDGTFRNSDTKWPARTTNALTVYLNGLRMPSEFAFWKGTEYRTFLLYIGIVALKECLPNEAYVHFLLVACSVTICSSKQYIQMLPVARAMLLQFIEIFGEIYGEHHITSNIHNLAHLVDDVEYFGELDTFSSYPFENALYRIKTIIRQGNQPLVQVAKRLMENFYCTMSCNNEKSTNESKQVVKSKLKIQIGDFTLGIDKVNCWFLTKNNEIGCLEKINCSRDGMVELNYAELVQKRNFFINPIESSSLNIYASENTHAHVKKSASPNDIKCKMACIQSLSGEQKIFIPVLHTNHY